MGAPVLVGAGIGAVTSLAAGRNPLQGALLGGVTGGAFGGASGFGSGFTEGGLFSLGSEATKQGIQSGITGLADDVAAGTVPTVGVQYPTETLLNESMLTQPDLMRMDKLFYKTPDTLFDKVKLLGKQGMDYVSENPYQVLQGGLVAGKLMSPQRPMIAPQPSGGSVKQGQQPNLGKPLAVTVPQQRRKIRIG